MKHETKDAQVSRHLCIFLVESRAKVRVRLSRYRAERYAGRPCTATRLPEVPIRWPISPIALQPDAPLAVMRCRNV